MRAVFADSYYYLAFVNERDTAHETAINYSQNFVGRSVTTEWVLMEVADALSAPDKRPIFLELLARLRNEPGLLIVEATHDLFERGIALVSQRPRQIVVPYGLHFVLGDAGSEYCGSADRRPSF